MEDGGGGGDAWGLGMEPSSVVTLAAAALAVSSSPATRGIAAGAGRAAALAAAVLVAILALLVAGLHASSRTRSPDWVRRFPRSRAELLELGEEALAGRARGCVSLRQVAPALRSGDILVCRHNHYNSWPALSPRDGAASAFADTGLMHAALVWLPPPRVRSVPRGGSHGGSGSYGGSGGEEKSDEGRDDAEGVGQPWVVEGWSGTWAGWTQEEDGSWRSGRGESEGGGEMRPCSDCAWDALTGEIFVNGIRAMPLARYLRCYAGTVFLRHLRPAAAAAMDVERFDAAVLEWRRHVAFRSDWAFTTPRHTMTIMLTLLDSAGPTADEVVDDGGSLCSEVAAGLLRAGGLWPPFEDGCREARAQRLLKPFEPPPGTFERAWRAACQEAGGRVRKPPATSTPLPRTVPQHLTSRGHSWCRLMWGDEVLLTP